MLKNINLTRRARRLRCLRCETKSAFMVPQERIELPTHALRNRRSLARLKSINTLRTSTAVYVEDMPGKSVSAGTNVATVNSPGGTA
jgi:hypothetical protein